MMLYQVLSSLSVAYFTNKKLQYVTVVNCWSDDENIQLFKALLSSSLTTIVVNQSMAADTARFISNLMQNYRSEVGIFLQFDCDASLNIIRSCSTERCFSQNYYWLIYNGLDLNTPTQSLVLDKLKDSNLHVDTEITYVDLRSARINKTHIEMDLFDVYNNGHHSGGRLRVNFDRTFSYSPTDVVGGTAISAGSLDPSLNDKTFKYVRRSNLSDLLLRVGTVYQIIDHRPLTTDSILAHLRSENNSQYDVLNRPTFQMGMHVQELLGYSATWVHHDRWSINDTFGGALGDIYTERTDIAYVLYALDWTRLAYTHPIAEMRHFRSVFLFRTYGSQRSSLLQNVFFKPFRTSVWLALTGCIIVLAIGLHAILGAENGRRTLSMTPSACLSVITALGAFCQQGADVVPASVNGRYLMMVVYLASLLTYTYYTTEVLSALISSPVKTNIRTLAQLAQSDLTVGLENASHTVTYLNVTNTPDLQLLKERKIRPVRNTSHLWMPLADGLELVRRGGHAYNCEGTHGYAHIRKTFDPVEMCDINEIYLRPKVQLGYISNKQSPYLELFKTKFRKLHETGIRSKYNRRWMPGKPPCMVDSIVFSVGMEYVGPLLVFLTASMALCLVILLVECVSFRMRMNFALNRPPHLHQWEGKDDVQPPYGYQQ